MEKLADFAGVFQKQTARRGTRIALQVKARFSMSERDLLGRPYDPWGPVLGEEEAEKLRHTYEQSGKHAGRGPKSYKRADARIAEDVCERLTRHPDVDATDIEVAVRTGDVTLSGTVEGRHLKWLVEDLVADVPGVKDVQNQIRVRAPKRKVS
jgi:osmotically-inducible protein OsmY